MSEISLHDPFLEEETQGYRRDLAADMILRNNFNLANGVVDERDLAATRYLLSQLSPDDIDDALRVVDEELSEESEI